MARETMSLLTTSEPLDFDKRSISRQPSVGDIEMEGFLRGFNLNYEDTIRQLDIYYGIVKRQILRYQSPTTGIFPVLSSETVVGSIRDSIYCGAATWCLYQAYR